MVNTTLRLLNLFISSVTEGEVQHKEFSESNTNYCLLVRAPTESEVNPEAPYGRSSTGSEVNAVAPHTAPY